MRVGVVTNASCAPLLYSFSPDGTMDSGQSLETGLYSETPSVHWSDIDR